MVDVNTKLRKLFEVLNKNLYRSKKVTELYKPLYDIIKSITDDLKKLEALQKKDSHFDKEIEEEIRKRKLISLFKNMNTAIVNIKEEIDFFYEEMSVGNKFLEKFRGYRTYVFENTKKSLEYIKKLIDTFNIEQFVLKFNVVGTIDLLDVANRIKGKKVGIDIIIPSSNINLIYEEILKSKTAQFRLISDSIVIYFDKDTVLSIEGPSKKIKLCDVNAKEFNAKLLDN